MSIAVPEKRPKAPPKLAAHEPVAERAAPDDKRLGKAEMALVHQVLEAVGDGVWDWNPAAGEVHFSDRWKEMFQYAKGEVDYFNLFHPDDAEATFQKIRDHLEGKTDRLSIDYRMKRSDGSYLWTRSRGRVIERDADGTAIRVVGTTTDIHQEKLAEQRLEQMNASLKLQADQLAEANQRLQEELERRRNVERAALEGEARTRELLHALERSEARLRHYLSASRLGTWEWRPATGEVTYSEQWSELLGYPAAELPNGPGAFLDIIHPADLDGMATTMQDLLAGESDFFSYEFRMATKHEGYKWFLSRGRAIEFDGSGNVALVAGTIADITTLKSYQERLRESEERWQFALEGGGQGAWDWNLDLDQAVFSDSWMRMIGYDPGELKLRSIEDWKSVVHPDDFESAWTKQLAHMRGLTPHYEAEFRMKHKAGHWVWVLSRGKVTSRNESGEALRIVGTHTDISDRKQQEEEIAHLNAMLTEWAARLEVANQELEAFSYSVSHDLRSPLRSIDGFSAALLEDCRDILPDEAKDHLDRIRKATKRMGELIDDLLLLSRVTRHEIVRSEVNLSQIVTYVVSELRDRTRKSKAKFVVQPGVRAWADPKLIQIVFENLIGNAIKFSSGQSEPRIEFGTGKLNGTTTYWVKDNGVGFDPARKGQLFRPFVRLHDQQSFEGHGIGLATVIRIINRHGGWIDATSEPGQGATFEFTLEP